VARVTVPPYSFTTLRRGASPSASGTRDAHGDAGQSGTAPAETSTGKSTRADAARTPRNPAPQEFVLENDRVRYTLAADATIREAIETGSGRSLLEAGRPGNVLTLYEDRPNNWDAWDVDLFYEGAVIETARGVEVTPLPGGSVRRGLRFRLAIGDSEIEQIVTLEVGSTRLDFDTRVRWRERHRMLRVAFPIAVRAESATFDIQYGFIRRPTHRNTLWDQARFESVAHRYVDLSEATHGVALLNDCKYGHKVLDNVIDLALLRSPTYPDPDADRGDHRFTYRLYPHEGDLEGSDVIERAAELNMGILSFPGYAVPDKQGAVDLDILAPPVWVEGDGLSMETLKRAERDDSLIVRIVETRGRASKGTLQATPNRYAICETNLLEWEDGPVEAVRGPIQVTLLPFEIRTYRLRPTEVTR
jgi:alpha-mannosidase